ncbi:toll/interleukin-1 receptor domain-containing protein [Commensalibacter melissae]|nr:toll/interleukin-1 receptor domain-containing protein [Commensalibacter melissae]
MGNIIKKNIKELLLSSVNVFVSSDDQSITLGNKWLETVSNNLEKCIFIIVLCSQESIKKPWINFECGAGWTRKIPIIPICHSNLTVANLPIPLNLLQGFDIQKQGKLTELISRISKEINIDTPKFDEPSILKEIKEFEKNYQINSNIKKELKEIEENNPSFYENLKVLFVNGQINSSNCNTFFKITQSSFDDIKQSLKNLQKNQLLEFQYKSDGALVLSSEVSGLIGTLRLNFKDFYNIYKQYLTSNPTTSSL